MYSCSQQPALEAAADGKTPEENTSPCPNTPPAAFSALWHPQNESLHPLHGQPLRHGVLASVTRPARPEASGGVQGARGCSAEDTAGHAGHHVTAAAEQDGDGDKPQRPLD